ncbi:MAG: sensor histidine kinase [Candidatus Zixiibacteriota bacterium]|nr:MAG: sensor histidine kinase [candidate division Zixibacteria bacterium]
MPWSPDPRWRDSDLAFFGAVTAGATHELNNVFSIIEQTAGLLEDWCADPEADVPAGCDKILNVTERIARQVQRGTELVRRLNGFAHSADEPCCNQEMNDLLENLLALMERFAAQRRVRLVFEPAGAPVTLTTRPFILEQAVFLAVSAALAGTAAQGIVTVQLTGGGAGVEITITGAPALPEAELPAAVGAWLGPPLWNLEGRVRTAARAGKYAIVLTIPKISEEVP